MLLLQQKRQQWPQTRTDAHKQEAATEMKGNGNITRSFSSGLTRNIDKNINRFYGSLL